MYLKETFIPPPDEVLQLIEKAGNAELCRDSDSMQSALERLWDDFDQSPDFSALSGLKSHQSLSDILNNQFPGHYEDLGFRRRASRQSKERNGAESRTVIVSAENILDEAEISQLALPDKNFAFNFPCRVEEFKTFYFDRFMMKKFGIEAGAIVAVVAVAEIKAGKLPLMSDEDDFKLAKAEYDAWARGYSI